MRKFNVIGFNPILCSIVTALILSAFSSLGMAEKPGIDAKTFMAGMAPEEFADPIALDDFIRRYPDSNEARVAFAIRYRLLEVMPSIEGYNHFIETYPEKLQSQIAIQEVFKLYRAVDRVSGYYDFISRYPNTPQAMVAIMRIQELMFEFACVRDTEECYDAFIAAFPDAPQVEAAKKRAEQKAFEKVKSEYDELKKKYNVDDNEAPQNNIIKNNLESKINAWARFVKNLQLPTDVNSTDTVDFSKIYKLKRDADILYEVYSSFNLERLDNNLSALSIDIRLNKIHETIKENHKELLKTLDESTDRICEGLENLKLCNQQLISEVRKGFKDLKTNFENVHIQLDKLNVQLSDVNTNLMKIHVTTSYAFSRLDAQLERANQNLINVRDSIVVGVQITQQELNKLNKTAEIMNNNMVEGFAQSINQMSQINANVVKGFVQTGTKLDAIGSKIDVTNQKIDVLNDNVVKGFEQTGQKLDNIGLKIDKTNEGIENLNGNVVKGFYVTGQKLDNIGSKIDVTNQELGILNENVSEGFRATNANIKKYGQAITDGLDLVREDMNTGFNTIHEDNIRTENSIKNFNQDFQKANEANMKHDVYKTIQEQKQSALLQNLDARYDNTKGSYKKSKYPVLNHAVKFLETLEELPAKEFLGDKDEKELGKLKYLKFVAPVLKFEHKVADALADTINEYRQDNTNKILAKNEAERKELNDLKNKVGILTRAHDMSGKDIPKEYEDKLMKAKSIEEMTDSIIQIGKHCNIDPRELAYAAKYF